MIPSFGGKTSCEYFFFGDDTAMENRLKQSASPYLRSHAENPIHWYEWGSAAFAEARERDVPIFLSIGYSSCHWCHARLWSMGIHSDCKASVSFVLEGKCPNYADPYDR